MDLATAFVLLSTSPDAGRAIGMWAPGLAGAVLLDLFQSGAVRQEDDRVHREAHRPRETVPAAAWDLLDRKRAPRTRAAVGRLATRGARDWRDVLLAGLAADGVVRREERSFGRVRHPAMDEAAHRELRAELAVVLERSDDPDPWLAGLAWALVASSGPQVLTGERAVRSSWRRTVRAWRREQTLGAVVTNVCRGVEDSVAAASAG